MLDDEISIDILKIINALWKKIWLILLVGALLGGVTFAYKKYTYVPLYQTSVTMYADANYQNNMANNSIDRLTGTCLAVLDTHMILEKVSSTTGLDLSYNELSSMISSTPISKSPLFKITISGNNPEEITLIANTIADLLPDMVSFVYKAPFDIGVVDYALVPTVPVANNIIKDTICASILGMMLVCGVITVHIIYIDWKDSIEKNGTAA